MALLLLFYVLMLFLNDVAFKFHFVIYNYTLVDVTYKFQPLVNLRRLKQPLLYSTHLLQACTFFYKNINKVIK